MLVAGRSDRMMRSVSGVDQGSELQNGEAPAVTAHALLQKEDGTGRCQPHRQGDRQQDRNQQRQDLLPIGSKLSVINGND